MRPALLLALFVCFCALLGLSAPAVAQDIVFGNSPPVCVSDACSAPVVHSHVAPARSPRRVVIRQENNITVVGSAQADAETMAATGSLRHQGNNRGCREGIGFSTQSADDAVRRCCFYGRYRAREIGVARGARGWFACVRYE